MTLDPSIFTSETPLSNEDRLYIWRTKLRGWSLERWWELTHPESPSLEVERQLLGVAEELPTFLRRQAE